MPRTGKHRRLARSRVRVVALSVAALLVAYLAFEWLRLPSAEPLRKQNPTTTALIEARAEEAKVAGRKPRRRQKWVAIDRVALTAIEAVLVSEDDAFFDHQGVDKKQMELVLRDAWRKGTLSRGASTLTQQLAKNLWLTTDRSLTRKLKELVLARRLESTLEKDRILELYLNVVEWGEGVYGIEAAAREHFGKSAAEVTPGEAAILAAMLPAPRRWLPARRPPTLHKRARLIIDRLERYRRLSSTVAASARIAIDDTVGPLRSNEPTVANPDPEAITEGGSVASPEVAPAEPEAAEAVPPGLASEPTP